jgi:TfoX/Sxy family transcriptional regulator of competence genes
MAFDEKLAARIRAQLEGRPDLSEKKMFGGIAFFIKGNMACGVLRDEMVMKVSGPEEAELLSRPGCRPFDFTGRPMRGLVMVAASAVPDDDTLAEWLDPALRRVISLPAKVKAPKAKATANAGKAKAAPAKPPQPGKTKAAPSRKARPPSKH